MSHIPITPFSRPNPSLTSKTTQYNSTMLSNASYVTLGTPALLGLFFRLVVHPLPNETSKKLVLHETARNRNSQSNALILRVAALAGGRIMVDGSPSTIELLRLSLGHLAEQKGAVWFYREAGQADTTPQAMEILEAVIENRLPIRLSGRPDYSDSKWIRWGTLARQTEGSINPECQLP